MSHIDSKVILCFMLHIHIPDLEPIVSHMDPRQRNQPDNAETGKNVGGDLSRRLCLLQMLLYN